MPFLILANPRPHRPHAKHSNRDRGAGRVERGQSQTFREAWRPRGFGHRPDARQRLDGVVTKAESLRDESCAAAWLWRDDDSHGAGGMRPSPLLRLVRSRNMGNISAGVGAWGSRPLNLPPLNIRNGPSGLRIGGASLPELRPRHHDPRTSAALACDAR